ncbi:MAG: mandelate racemase, partial [Pseudomonadota bacterium]
WGSDIATAASVHLGVASDPKYVMNICDLSRYVGPRIAPDGPVHDSGWIAPADAPGLGVSPNLDTLGTPNARFA